MAPKMNDPAIQRYGTALTIEEVGAKAQRPPELSVPLVVAVAVASVLLFFAGRAEPVEFTHSDVLDLADFCTDGQYIGGCVACKSCADYEFANGGCSYFKDTFCTYCQPINDCPRELVDCTGFHDSHCKKCDCDDPIKNWSDHEVRHYLAHHPDGDGKAAIEVEPETYGCYITSELNDHGAGTCKPCTVCPIGKYQKHACDQDSNTDTVCVKCAECDEHEWTSKACTYDSNTECSECSYCGDEHGKTAGTYAAKHCEAGDPLNAGSDVICKTCSFCDDGDYVSGFCEAGAHESDTPEGVGSDTQCLVCSTCEGADHETQDWTQWKEHIAGADGMCKKGERFPGDGCDDSDKEDGKCVNHDTICQDCLYPEEDANCQKDGTNCDFFFSTPCVSTSYQAPVLEQCQTCGGNTFELRGCSAFQATVCKACAENRGVDPNTGEEVSGLIEHCNFEDHRCANDGSFTEEDMGLHRALVLKASNFEPGVKAIVNFTMTPEINYDNVVLSWCAREDKTGACNGLPDDKIWWTDGGKDKADPPKGQDESEECNFDACQDGFFGTQCQYAKVYQSCGERKSFMTRFAFKGRHWYNDGASTDPTPSLHYAMSEDRSKNQFVTWCYMQCEEHPFCHAFEVVDGGVNSHESGDWSLDKDTKCEFYSDPEFCPGGNDVPDYTRDCYTNVLRDPDAIKRVNACPGEVTAGGVPALAPPSFPPGKGPTEPDTGGADCDSYEGKTYCPALDECVDRSRTPCAPIARPRKSLLRDQCADEGEVFCYCTGTCMGPAEDCGDRHYDDMPEDAGLTRSGLIAEDCRAVLNNVQAVEEESADAVGQ